MIGADSPGAFNRARHIVTSMIESPKDMETKYSIVKYGKDSKVVATPDDYQDNLKLLDILKDMDWQSKGVDALGAVDKARNIFKESGNPQALRRMIVFLDSIAGYNEVGDAKEDIEKKDGIKIVTVIGDEARDNVTPDDPSTVIDDPNTDLGNTTLPISKVVYKGW